MATPEQMIELPEIPPTSRALLTGFRAPVRAESFETGPFGVTGVIPPGLEGIVMWVGPNPAIIDDPEIYDPADGDGMVHALSITDGEVRSVRSRFIATRSMVERLGLRAPQGPLAAAGPTANTTLVRIANRIIALDGKGLGYRITTGLATACVEDFDTMLTTPMGTATVVDPETGGAAFLGLDPEGPPHVRLHEVSGQGVLTVTTALPLGATGATPGLGATRSTIAVVESSLLAHVPQGDDDVRNDITFNPDRRPAVGLLPRGRPGSEITWCASSPGHIGDVLEMRDTADGAELVVVRSVPERSDDPSWRPHRRVGSLEKLTVDGSRRSVTLDQLDDLVIDGASSDAAELMEHRRHHYAATADGSMLVRYNSTSGVAQRRELPAELVASRPLFARDPEGRSDEEGWIIVPCFDRTSSLTTVLILDGTRFLGAPQAIVTLPTRLPFDLTGLFVGAEAFR